MRTLTREQVLAMTPGRELDCLVAERVLGWTRCFEGLRAVREADPNEECQAEIVTGLAPFASMHRRVPGYSTDIAAAWEILPMFTGERRKDFFFLLTDAIRCRLGSSFYPRFSEILFLLLPEDICRAALLTIVEAE